uniref:Uncharacterized protein n=1 Tax=Alexandrium monilatum TaxID=311494 RepID=A0A7S4UWY1_9DINO
MAGSAAADQQPVARDSSEEEESSPLLDHFGEEEARAASKEYGAFGGSDRVSSIAEELAQHGSKYDWIVEAHAFQEYPHALVCARLTYVFLLMVVLMSVVILLFYYFLGVVQIEREYYWYDRIKVPTLILCPDWGRGDSGPGGFRSFVMGSVTRGLFPSAEGLTRTINHTVHDCVEAGQVRCKCVGFGSEYLEKHAHSTDLVSVRFGAVSSSPAFFFGFGDPGHALEGAHTYGYGLLRTRSLGYLTLHLLDVKDEKIRMSLRGGNISHFRDTRIYDWEQAGNAVPSADNHTELLFGFKTFQVTRDKTFAAIWSPFAIATVIAMGMSLINNLNIFGLVWPQQQHPIFTQREPSILLRCLCGRCGCMQRRLHRTRPRTRLEMLLAEHQEQMHSPRVGTSRNV